MQASVPSPQRGEHLCLWSSAMIDPRPIFLEQGVGQDDKLSHDCGECELGFFAVFEQAVVEDAEVWIVSGSGEGGPVESAARIGPAALDVALSSDVAAVVGEWGEACQAGDGVAVETSELGEIDEQVGGDARADAG